MAYLGYLCLGGRQIVNDCRTLQRVADGSGPPGIVCRECDPCCGDLSAGLGYPNGYNPVDLPWWDGSQDAADFAGILIENIEGLEPGAFTRPVAETSGIGAVIGAGRQAAPNIVVTGLLMAATCCAQEYGLRWLRRALKTSCAPGMGCAGEDLLFLSCEPESPDEDCPNIETTTIFEETWPDASWSQWFVEASLNPPTFSALGGTLTADVPAALSFIYYRPNVGTFPSLQDGYTYQWQITLDNTGGAQTRVDYNFYELASQGIFDLPRDWSVTYFSDGSLSYDGGTGSANVPVTGDSFYRLRRSGAVIYLESAPAADGPWTEIYSEGDYTATILDTQFEVVFGGQVGGGGDAFLGPISYSFEAEAPFDFEAWLAPYYRTLKGVALIDGPRVIERVPRACPTCENCPIYRVQWTMAASKPCVFTDPVEILAPTSFTCGEIGTDCIIFDDSDTCEPEDDGCTTVEDCNLDPECPTSVSPPTVPAITNPCVEECTSVVSCRVCVDVPAGTFDSNTEGTLIVTIFAGSEPLRRINLKVWQNPLDFDPDLLDDCDVCAELNISYLGPNATLTIDGTTGTAMIDCPNSAGPVRANPFIASGSGSPAFSYPDLDGCVGQYTVCITTGAPAAMDAYVQISAVGREC